MQEKSITVSSLSQKTISPKPGATWKAFSVYQILGNDGNTYETTDQKYYQSLTMGQIVSLKFTTESKNVGGRIYTSYKIVTPNSKASASAEILEYFQKMEARILSAIRQTQGTSTPSKKEEIHEEPRMSEADDFITVEDLDF